MLDDRTLLVLAGLVVSVPLSVLLITPVINLVTETLISLRLYLRRRIRSRNQNHDQ